MLLPKVLSFHPPFFNYQSTSDLQSRSHIIYKNTMEIKAWLQRNRTMLFSLIICVGGAVTALIAIGHIRRAESDGHTLSTEDLNYFRLAFGIIISMVGAIRLLFIYILCMLSFFRPMRPSTTNNDRSNKRAEKRDRFSAELL
jgi:hypothetical protein